MVRHLDITEPFLCGEGGAWQKVLEKKDLAKAAVKPSPLPYYFFTTTFTIGKGWAWQMGV